MKWFGALVVVFQLSAVQAGTLAGTVIGVHDGDTITLLTYDYKSIKIRLSQIDAPEKNQPFGTVAKQALSDRIMRQPIQVIPETTDRYGRTAGTVLWNGVDINKEMVQKGMAWVYTQYAHDPAYVAAQEYAKTYRIGLWIDAHPVAPWLFRHDPNAKAQALPKPPDVKKPFWFGWLGAGCNKKSCREMTSCEEAKHYLKDCNLQRLDKDHNGIPCESLCSGQ